jgi:hypothetical protein
MNDMLVAVRRAAVISLSGIDIARAPSEGPMSHQQLFFMFW